ncbi:gastric triacylglycerol lipase-like [Photinus pyralis]|uniref:gastric triacylglycerol lipase-like n=1 Tax=Photinus pyralis TaxID=7054 RepID=UPI0012672D98|nr:gastric triacylglycerol lipase-like [Photinus pyralis]
MYRITGHYNINAITTTKHLSYTGTTCIMEITTVSLLVICSPLCMAIYTSNYIHPDAGISSKEIIQKYGYPLEIHTIETEDGYLLETYRIPYGKRNLTSKSQLPVLLVPGLVCTSLIYLNLGPGLSLGFMLADEGYDVWLANTRGTRWSKRHKFLDAVQNEKEFFDYSFHEVGLYDITANIDYILKRTNFKKLFYVGHSQGTTSFFAMAATKPQYNDRIILMIALAPVAYVFNVQNPVVTFVKHHLPEIQKLAEKNRVYELASYSPPLASLGSLLCNDYAVTQIFCASIFYFFGGYSPHFNTTALPAIIAEYPAGTSTRMIFHYVQLAISEQFQMYDYGIDENVKKYGTKTPSKYNISAITAPVALYYGGSDGLSTRSDVEVLIPQLPNLVEKQFIKDYSHMDFQWAKNIVPVLHSKLIEIIKKYSKK